MLNQWLPLLQEKLHEKKLLQLTQNEFEDVVACVHAMRDHASRTNMSSFGLRGPQSNMSTDERARNFGKWLYEQKSRDGWNVLETIHYVLYAAPLEKAPERIFEVCHDPGRKISHFGISSLGEIVGWVHPNYSPPRNGRTSKALVALGFDVHVHSE